MIYNELHTAAADYLMQLFRDTRESCLPIYYADCTPEGYVITYPMAWDRDAARSLAARLTELLQQLEQLAAQYDRLLESREGLSDQLLEVWNTYVRPLDPHGMDEELLHQLWMKEEAGEPMDPEELRICRQYRQWMQQQCLRRLPWGSCAPTALITHAMRFAKLVHLQAPATVVKNEACCLAKEMALYYCAKPFHICRCCAEAYELGEAGTADWSVCPVCLWQEDHTPEEAVSSANGDSLMNYRKAFFERQSADF